jgi:hypothetical protein
MTNRKFFRAIAAAILFSSLAACQSTVTPMTTESPVAASSEVAAQVTPIDAANFLNSFFAANPGKPLELQGSRGVSFHIFPDDRFFFDAKVSTNTMVSSKEGNVICAEGARTWTGACLTLESFQGGVLSGSFRYGNGRGGSFRSRPLSL